MNLRSAVSLSGGVWNPKKCATVMLSLILSSTTQTMTDPSSVSQLHLIRLDIFNHPKKSINSSVCYASFFCSQDITVDGNHQEVQLKNLTSGTSYTVFVIARALNGSTRSKDLTFHTKRYGGEFLLYSYVH